jgi:hypothetical protein
MSNNNQIEQEQIIEAIIQRIKDEDKKHSKSIKDWYRIAANKIYATFDIKIKEVTMSNKQQTALDFLLTELDIAKLISREKLTMAAEVVRQAKAMHKQEIYQTYISAIKEYMIDPLGDTLYRIDAEEYYNETFGDNNMGENNGEITTDNIPDTNEGNTSTTGNISNTWGGDTSSTTGNISNTWGSDRLNVNGNVNAWSGGHIKTVTGTIISDRTGTKTEDDNRIKAEKQIWDRTVNWDIMNKYTRANDEEQAPYNVKTNVVTSGKTDDGTLAVIEITIDIKQR